MSGEYRKGRHSVGFAALYCVGVTWLPHDCIVLARGVMGGQGKEERCVQVHCVSEQ